MRRQARVSMVAWLAAVVVGPTALFQPADGDAASFQGLGPKTDFPSAVSADGTVVVGVLNDGKTFRWTAENGAESTGRYDWLSDISGDGSVVVGTRDNKPFRWIQDGGMAFLEMPPEPLVEGKIILIQRWGAAEAISADGSVVVGWSRSGVDWETVPEDPDIPPERHSTWQSGVLRWVGGNMQIIDLDIVEDRDIIHQATCVSADGSVVGIERYSGSVVRWTAGKGFDAVYSPPLFDSAFCSDMSADGSVLVGEIYDPYPEAVRWLPDALPDAETTEHLGFLPGRSYSGANAVSADGTTVVGASFNFDSWGMATLGRPFIWDAKNGMRDLTVELDDHGVDLTGWDLQGATDISADGRTIVGYGDNPSGEPEAWLATLPKLYGVLVGSRDIAIKKGEQGDYDIVAVDGIADAEAIDEKLQAFSMHAGSSVLRFHYDSPATGSGAAVHAAIESFEPEDETPDGWLHGVQPGDVFVFFYSGHGSGGAGTSENLDINISGTDAFISDNELTQWFSNDKWAEVNKLFILDSCYAGGFGASDDGGPEPDADLMSLPHCALLAACPETGKTGTTLNPFRFGTGYFSNILADALELVGRHAAADTDSNGLSFEELGTFIGSEIAYQIAQGTTYDGYIKDHPVGDDITPQTFEPSFYYWASDDFELNLGAAPIPEPSTLALLTIAALALLTYGWRRRRRG